MYKEDKMKLNAEIAAQLVVAMVNKTPGFSTGSFSSGAYKHIVTECVTAAKAIIDESFKDEQKPAR